MIGLELRLKRIRAGFKQYEVAAKVGISPNKLCEIELGRHTATPILLERIRDVIQSRGGDKRRHSGRPSR